MIILKKFKSKIGESIIETLISTLIAALSMVMFASMVIASKNIVTESDTKLRAYYSGSSNLISKTNVYTQTNGPINIHVNENGTYYYEYGSTS